MIALNTELRLKGGTRIRIEGLLGAGGEGIVYRAVDVCSGEPGAFKLFKTVTPERRERTKALVALRIGEWSELLCAPANYCDDRYLGHLSPLAPGVRLDEHLASPRNSYPDTLKLAIAFAHGHAILNAHGVAQADIALSQETVFPTSAGFELRMFDFDNSRIPGQPPPPCFGQEDWMAPELRRALKGGKPCLPDELSDRFSIGAVMHSLLLAKDVAFGFDGTPELFEKAMSGGWPHDPALGLSQGIDGGFPSTILNAELATLLRRSLSPNREERPSASEWVDGLSRSIRLLWIDPRCHGPSFIDPGRTRCPTCGKEFPRLKFVFPALRKEIVCDTAAISVGRADLASPMVSRLHAIARQRGPETYLESLGRNGVFRRSGRAWLRLPPDPVPVLEGDRLRFADVECLVQTAD
jgi:serine/threonine protein kinase